MADHKRPNLKQIRIKQSVCARLDERKGEDDSYTDVIKALLDENERLKARCQELENDKQVFTRLAMSNPRNVKPEPADEEVEKAVQQFKERMQQKEEQQT